MLGGHPIRTWSATQHAYALSSAEAELYAMVEGVTRAKGLCSLANDLGFALDHFPIQFSCMLLGSLKDPLAVLSLVNELDQLLLTLITTGSALLIMP